MNKTTIFVDKISGSGSIEQAYQQSIADRVRFSGLSYPPSPPHLKEAIMQHGEKYEDAIGYCTSFYCQMYSKSIKIIVFFDK